MSERLCPSCGSPVEPQAVYCGGCGLNLASASAAMGAPLGDSQPLPEPPPRPQPASAMPAQLPPAAERAEQLPTPAAAAPYIPPPAPPVVGPLPMQAPEPPAKKAPTAPSVERSLAIAAVVLGIAVLTVFGIIFVKASQRERVDNAGVLADRALPPPPAPGGPPPPANALEAGGDNGQGADTDMDAEIAKLESGLKDVQPADPQDLQDYAARYALLSPGGQIVPERATVYAAGFNDLPRLKALLALHPDLGFVDDKGQTALNAAASNGSREALLMLLEAGADVNFAPPGKGGAPLHQAAMGGDSLSAQILLNHGADAEAFSEAGLTPLLQAAGSGNAAVAQVLLAHGASVDTRSQDGLTALMAAASAKQAEMLHLLLGAGADANLSDPDGWTAMHYAAAAGDEDCLNILDSAGANHDARNADGDTPADVARKYGFSIDQSGP